MGLQVQRKGGEGWLYGGPVKPEVPSLWRMMKSRERVKACELWRAQGGECKLLPLAYRIGMRGSLELEVIIFRENERRSGHWGGDLGLHCSDSAEGWNCHLIQEIQVISGIGLLGC